MASSLFILPQEIWDSIINNLNISSLYSLHWVDRFFHYRIQECFSKKEYNTVLIHNKKIITPLPHVYTEYSKISTSKGALYIINNMIEPYGIKRSELTFYSNDPLLTTIRTYKEFTIVARGIYKGLYHENPYFVRRESLHESVFSFVICEAIIRLASYLIPQCYSMKRNKERYIEWIPPLLPEGKMINWNSCLYIIDEATEMVQTIFPYFGCSLLNGALILYFNEDK